MCMQVLSAEVVADLAASTDAAEFAAAAERSLGTLANEDSALGFMVSPDPNPNAPSISLDLTDLPRSPSITLSSLRPPSHRSPSISLCPCR